MILLRVLFALAIGAVGFIAALVVGFVGIASLYAGHSLAGEIGSLLILVLIEGVIFVGTFYIVIKVTGPIPSDR